MAATIVKDMPKPERISRNLSLLSGAISFGVYHTGGEPLLGITQMFKTCLRVVCESKKGYLFEFDKAAKKMKVYSQAGTEVLNNTDLSALTDVGFMAVGLG